MIRRSIARKYRELLELREQVSKAEAAIAARRRSVVALNELRAMLAISNADQVAAAAAP
jgi:hypothetical protein